MSCKKNSLYCSLSHFRTPQLCPRLFRPLHRRSHHGPGPTWLVLISALPQTFLRQLSALQFVSSVPPEARQAIAAKLKQENPKVLQLGIRTQRLPQSTSRLATGIKILHWQHQVIPKTPWRQQMNPSVPEVGQTC